MVVVQVDDERHRLEEEAWFETGHVRAVTQDPIGIGYETVKAAVEAIDGKELPKTIDTGFYWYDASNIDDEEIQAVLYE